MKRRGARGPCQAARIYIHSRHRGTDFSAPRRGLIFRQRESPAAGDPCCLRVRANAIAIVVPVTITTFQSLALNPIPYVYIVTVIGNCGFILPSSAGGPAVAAGYGVNLQTMAAKGLIASLLVLGVLMTVGYALARWWPAFGVA